MSGHQSCPEFSDEPLCLGNNENETDPSNSSTGINKSVHNFISVHNFQFREIPYGNPPFDSLPGQYRFYFPQCYQNLSYRLDCQRAYDNINNIVNFIEQYAYDEQKLGTEYITSINCVQPENCPEEKKWYPAAWIFWRNTTVYGEYRLDGNKRSVAILTDVVAHEFCHRLIYEKFERKREGSGRYGLGGEEQSASLEESLCDIFAIIVSNSSKDIIDWDWRIGRNILGEGKVIRDPSNSTPHPINPDRNQYNHPICMRGAYKDYSEYYHENSNIYSRAVYLWLTATDEWGQYLFSRDFAAKLFFETLKRIDEKCQFGNCGSIMYGVAEQLLRGDLREAQQLESIQGAFNSVGIYLPQSSTFRN